MRRLPGFECYRFDHMMHVVGANTDLNVILRTIHHFFNVEKTHCLLYCVLCHTQYLSTSDGYQVWGATGMIGCMSWERVTTTRRARVQSATGGFVLEIKKKRSNMQAFLLL